jgi:Ca-activated chloride channel family protein
MVNRTLRVWLVSALALTTVVSLAAQDAPIATFRSSISYVSITAVVRDRHGRSVRSLSRNDFQIRDAGQQRPVIDVRSEESAPASIALLVDGSGSMRVGGCDATAVRISKAVLDSLQDGRDEAALFTFDRRLVTLHDFTKDMGAVRSSLRDVESWGTTSLFDAIGGTAGIVAQKSQNRRAVIVFTDGADNASAYTAEEIGAVASSIDVPVYVFALGTAQSPTSTVAPPLAELARLTGGEYFAASTDLAIKASINTLVDELRHQYVLAFEAAPGGGWRGVQVIARDPSFRVRTRRYYFAADSE